MLYQGCQPLYPKEPQLACTLLEPTAKPANTPKIKANRFISDSFTEYEGLSLSKSISTPTFSDTPEGLRHCQSVIRRISLIIKSEEITGTNGIITIY
jgi:hypothetical protein